jgi:hypothetical protein
MAATVDSADDWVEGSSTERSPGRLLFLAGLLDAGEAEGMISDDVEGHVAVLTVTAG